MAIDCHIHFDPEILTLENMLACMDRHGVEKAALIATMVEPFYLDGKAKQAASSLLRYTLMRANPLGQVAYMTTIDSKGNFILLGKNTAYMRSPTTPRWRKRWPSTRTSSWAGSSSTRPRVGTLWRRLRNGAPSPAWWG